MSFEKPKYVEYKNRADNASHNIAKAKHDTTPNDETWPEVGLHEYPHWKKTWESSFQIQDFFTEDEVEWFTDRMFRHHTDRRIKDSGTLHFFDNMGEIIDHFFDKFQSIMPELQKGDMSHTGNFVFSTNPYNVHIDTGSRHYRDHDPNYVPYKQIIIPLWVSPMGGMSATAIYKQRAISYGTNFVRGFQKEFRTDVWRSVKDYSVVPLFNVDGSPVTDLEKLFENEVYVDWLTNVPYDSLTGLEAEGFYNWDRRSIIVFDRCCLHSGTDFTKYGTKSKAGLTIMTNRIVPNLSSDATPE